MKPDGTRAAQGILEMVQLLTVTKFGPDAAFTIQDQLFIEQPLARIIERYGDLADRYSAFVDPAMLIAGVVLYTRRLAEIANAKETANQQPPAPPPAPPNGSKPYDPVSADRPEFLSMIQHTLDRK